MINNTTLRYYSSRRLNHLWWPGGLPVIPAMDGGPASPKTIDLMIKYLIFFGSRWENLVLSWTGGRHDARQLS